MTIAASRQFAPLVALIAAVATPAPALAVDWREVAVDESSNRYLVDEHRITRRDGLVRAYVRTEYARPRVREDLERPVFAAVDRLAVRCADQSFALETRSYVTADGEEVLALAIGREQLEFRPVAKGTPSAAIVRRLCARQSR